MMSAPQAHPQKNEGIHLTLDSWRKWRWEDSWKMSNKEVAAAVARGDYTLDDNEGDAPEFVHASPELTSHVEALTLLFSSPTPPVRHVQPHAHFSVAFGFGDASGLGFGHTVALTDKLHYSRGQWASSISSHNSSNYRELFNLVLTLEDMFSQGYLANTEIFLFTDNSTAEAAFYKGTFSNKELFTLILRLRKLQMDSGAFFHVLLVSGKCMIAQGTDGLSRGSTFDGVLAGTPMLQYVPLHLSAMDRSATITTWLESWASSDGVPFTILEPFAWFSSGHRSPRGVWCPPPAAADAALPEVAKAIHRHPHLSHIILIPRLMTSHWRRLFGKIVDIQFTVPLGCTFWPLTNFEPLVVGIVFPLTRHPPWRLCGTTFMDCMARELSALPPSDHTWGRPLLCQLFLQTWRL